MWEQLMQMLQTLPKAGVPMPQGGAGALPTVPSPPPAPTSVAPSMSDVMKRINGVAQGFQKGAGALPAAQPPPVATPRVAPPQPYTPGATPGGLGAGGGGDIIQMLMGLPGMQSMMGQGAGGGMPQNQTGVGATPGTGMPSLAELMSMRR